LVRRALLFVAGLVLSAGALSPLYSANSNVESPLRSDHPVKLQKAQVVFNVNQLATIGDMPVVLGRLLLLTNDLRESGGKRRLCAAQRIEEHPSDYGTLL
jgi:hypothetical protein